MKYLIIAMNVTVFCHLMFMSFAVAQDAKQETGDYVEPYSLRYEYIMSGLKEGDDIDQYIKRQSGFFRGRENLTKDDVLKRRNKFLYGSLYMQAKALYKADLNFDGTISLEEIKQHVMSERNIQERTGGWESDVKRFLVHDVNGDNIISFEEINKPSDHRRRYDLYRQSGNAKAEDYLYFDPNSDGVLTHEEFETLARQVFSLADLDNDGFFTNKDKVEYSAGEFTTKCIIPNLSENNDVAVHFVKDFSGTVEGRLDFQIDRRSDESGHYAKIVINKPQENVGLVLSSTMPIIWDISAVGYTNVVGVVVSGINTSILLGLDKDVPVIKNNWESLMPCGRHIEGRRDGFRNNDFVGLHSFSRAIFNAPTEQYHEVAKNHMQKPLLIIGDEDGLDEDQFILNDSLEEFRAPHTPYTGKKGLQDAIDQGYIKKMSQDEIGFVSELIKEEADSQRMPDFSLYTFYIVLKNGFHYPAGINWNTFIIPKNVEMPLGKIPYGVKRFYLNEIDCRDHGEGSDLCQ